MQETPAKSHFRLSLHVCLPGLYIYKLDFHVADEKRLLPREPDDSIVTWTQWQYLVRELIAQPHPDKIHPHFYRAELRLSRINTTHRIRKLLFTQAYFGGRNNYGSFFCGKLAWIALKGGAVCLYTPCNFGAYRFG